MGVQPSCSTPPEGSEPPGAGEAGPHLLRAGGGGRCPLQGALGSVLPQPRTGLLPATASSGDLRRPEPPPLAVPPATDTSPPVRPPDLGSSPPCRKPTFPGAPRPNPGVSPRSPPPPFDAGSPLVRSPRPRFEAEPASASLSLLLLGILSTILFFKGFFFFFFLRCVRAVAWRRRSYSTASLSVAIPSSLSFKSLRPRLRGRGRARPEDARRVLKPFQRLVPGQDPNQSSRPAASRNKAHAMAKP